MPRPAPPRPLELLWRGPPRDALDAARGAVEAAGGAVVDAHAFSDLHLHLAVELDPAAATALLAALAAAGLEVEARAAEALLAAATPPSAELRLALGLRLCQGTGELRRDVPSVPG